MLLWTVDSNSTAIVSLSNPIHGWKRRGTAPQPPRTNNALEPTHNQREQSTARNTPGNRNRVPSFWPEAPWRSLVVALGTLVSLGMDSRRPCWRLSPCPLPGQDDARDSRVILTRGIHSRPILPRKNAQSCSPLGPDPEPPVSLPPTNPAAGRHQQCQRTPRAAAVVAAFPWAWYALVCVELGPSGQQAG